MSESNFDNSIEHFAPDNLCGTADFAVFEGCANTGKEILTQPLPTTVDVSGLVDMSATVEVEHIDVKSLPKRHVYRFVKRLFDIVISLCGLIVLSPFLIIVAVAVKASSAGSIIFKQERFGKNRTPFICYKFRSMKTDTPNNIPSRDMQENPDVMTPVGLFLRKTSIDELPQMLNILKGDMSFIGPRPMILSEKEQIDLREPYHANDIKPGLTGWAQINGRDAITIEEKARLDGFYRQNMSFLLDLKIFIKSIEVVVKKTGYWSPKK